MNDRILTLTQVSREKILPLSRATLYRLASSGEGPFRKRRGQWMTTESDLLQWVRSGEQGIRKRPAPTERFLQEVRELRKKVA